MMPPKMQIDSKRKASFAVLSESNVAKRPKITSGSADPLSVPHPGFQESEDNGIVLRTYYPHEMNNVRALAYNNNVLTRPIELLNSALEETVDARETVKVKESVVHWFKCDLRTRDNKSLYMASEKARENGVPLICMYIVSPQDFEAHLTAPIRVDFILRTLEVLKADLGRLDIPLYVETVEKRRNVEGRILELLQEWGTSHLFCNMEYEVDELRRESRLVRSLLQNGIAMKVVHDTCVVAPGELSSGTGKQYAVYTPWYRSWVAHVHSNISLLDLFEPPRKNPETARTRYMSVFAKDIPKAPENKRLTDEEKKRFRSMWPAGEGEAHERLAKFAKERIGGYQDNRNLPATNGTSSLSVHFASGTLSARTAVRTAREHNSTPRVDGGNAGIQTWVSEVAWRDFYKHVLVNWPYVW